MLINEVVLVDVVRTAFGRAGEKGIFWKTRAEDLAVPLLKALIYRNPGLTPDMVEDSIWGVTNQVKEQAGTLGRMITMLADWGWEIPGCSIDRMCASGLTAIGFAATTIASGMADCLIAGGVEHMGHFPMGVMRDPHPRAEELLGQQVAAHGPVERLRAVLDQPVGARRQRFFPAQPDLSGQCQRAGHFTGDDRAAAYTCRAEARA